MPSRIPSRSPSPFPTGVIKFTNCWLVKHNKLVYADLWISETTGRILDGQKVFYEYRVGPDRIIDLGGRIVSPGLIDVQLNGGYGFDFSVAPEEISNYGKELARLNKSLVRTGVTSYLPTLTSQKSQVYQKVLPFLGPSGYRRVASEGSESLGAFVEGPFLNPAKNGIHKKSVLRSPTNGISDLEDCYGAANVDSDSSPIRLFNQAPEQAGALETIRELKKRDFKVAIGHSAATYEQAREAIDAGATMITHLFNAMEGLHHRNPGIFGLLGTQSMPHIKKPFFGIISDGIHLHPTAINIAWNAHPEGFILVTDSMALLGMPDGTYDWTNGDRIVKKGYVLTLEGSDKIAGASSTLLECVNNFLAWSGVSIAEALGAVTSTPARMLDMNTIKGTLDPGADADLVILENIESADGMKQLNLAQVWKFGQCVFDQNEGAYAGQF